MRITLSLDDNLAKEARRIAVERGTTLTAMVRSYLERVAAENAKSERQRRDLEALEKSFRDVQINCGKKTWRREDLYDRPSRFGRGNH